MKIAQLDKELNAITSDLLNTKVRVEKRNTLTSKQIYKLAKTSDDLQNQLNENLEKIIFLATPSEMLRPKEQSFLYWTTNFAEKAQQFVQKNNIKLLFTMWAKLINQRIAGENSASSSLRSLQDGIAFLRTKRKQQEKSKKITTSEILDAEVKKQELTNQYNQLVLISANKDAASSFYDKLGIDLYHGLRHPHILQIENIIKSASHSLYDRNRLQFVKENQKINRIIFRPQKVAIKQTPAPAIQTQPVTDSFEKLALKMLELNSNKNKPNNLDKLTLPQIKDKKRNISDSVIVEDLTETKTIREPEIDFVAMQQEIKPTTLSSLT